MAVIDFFDKGWASVPSAIAYRTADETWTYDAAGRMSCRVAHGLRAAGIARQTPVAVLSPNAPLAWICVLGIWRSGAVWVPLNPGSPAADNAALIDRFDVELVFFHPSLATAMADIADACPQIQAVALADGTENVTFDDWLADAPETTPDMDYDMDDVVALMPTGGTTGLPKGVMNTHRSLSVMVVHQMLAMSYDEGETIVNLVAAPMTHTAGLLTLQTTARGGTVAIIPRAAPDLVLNAIATFGVTDLFLPPTVVYRLLDVLDRYDADTSSLKYLLYGAAPMSVEKLRVGVQRLGSVFLQLYGQVEAPAAIAFLRPSEHVVNGELAGDDRLSSCGRPYPLVSVRVVDPDTDTPTAVGTTGEICVRGDLLMKGYYKDPQRTAETIRDGWLHTGDMGHLDDHGYLHLTDRRKDLIISGGFNVYPNEVEQVIWSHPAVQDCAVVGAPDDDWGERVTAEAGEVIEVVGGSSGHESADVLARLAADVPTLITRTEHQVRELSTYDALSDAELAQAIRRNVDDAVTTLQADAIPSHDQLAELAEKVVRRRVEQGIPVEDMMRTYRVSLAVINERFIELAVEADVSSRESLRCSRLLWSLSDAFMTCVAQEYQRLSVESALLDDQAKADLVQGLLFGTGNHPEMVRACETRGLDPSVPFHAIRARVTEPAALPAVCRELQRSGGHHGGAAIVSPFRGDAIGLTSRPPHAIAAVVVALGPPVPLAELAASFTSASRVLDAAALLDFTGVVSVADVSWRVAAINDTEVSRLLHARYIAPLRERGAFGEQLLQSVRHFLACDRNVAAAAEAMFLHKNTLRYRLRKFEEIASASLEATDVIVELAWALAVDAAAGHRPDT